MVKRILRWGAPVTYVGVVVLVGLSLVAVLTRSPDTRSNFQDAPGGYDRTRLSTLGAVDQYDGLGQRLPAEPAAVFVGAGCAQCHGLKGQGGTVGPEIWNKEDAQKVLTVVREGGGGMPAYPAARLSDEQVTALVAYLQEQRRLYPELAQPSKAQAKGAP
jgi:mono/diheme cytochrome c family protein